MGKNELAGVTAWPFERKCPECGKIFGGTTLENWAYRDGQQYLCSWSCVRKREQKKAEAELKAAAKKRKTKKLTPAQKEGLIRRLVYSGMSNEEISKETGMSVQLVNYYRRKIEEAFET